LPSIAAGGWCSPYAELRATTTPRSWSVDDLDLDGRSEATRTIITALGSIGFFARGVVLCMVGWFLVESALDDDPNHTGGLDLALRRLADSEHGPGLLRLVAAGLIFFGVYRIIEARLRTRSAVTNP
jgi:hypothetical protein